MTRSRAVSDGTVVLLNGPAGIGKTTIGRRLAATPRNGVCVHGDELKQFVVTREPGSVDQGLGYVGGAALADVFLEAGYELVVFEFIFSQYQHVDRFLHAMRSDVPVHLLTLWAPLAIVVKREARRPHRERLGSRVTECWQELAANISELGALVDASRPPDDVTADVARRVEAGEALIHKTRREN